MNVTALHLRGEPSGVEDGAESKRKTIAGFIDKPAGMVLGDLHGSLAVLAKTSVKHTWFRLASK